MDLRFNKQQEAIMMSRAMNKLGFRKSSIKSPPSQISPPLPLSNKPSFFRGRKLISPLSSPPPYYYSLINNKPY